MTPFGRYLELLRKDRQLKQKDIAEFLDVHPSYISLVENGRKAPPPLYIQEKLIKFLKLSHNEKQLFTLYADSSAHVFHLPENLKLNAFILANAFHKYLDVLTDEQIKIVDAVLDISRCSEKRNQISSREMEGVMK